MNYGNKNAVMQTSKDGCKNLRSKSNAALTERPANKSAKLKNSSGVKPRNAIDSYESKPATASVKAPDSGENLTDKDGTQINAREMPSGKDKTKRKRVNALSAMIAVDVSDKRVMMPARKSGRLTDSAARMSARKKTPKNGPDASDAIMEMPLRRRKETLE